MATTPGGLTGEEARQRFTRSGPNEPAPGHGASEIAQLLRFFLNPLVIILLVASLVSAILGERVNAGIIATMVLFSVALNFVQAYRSQRAVERLRAGVAPTASVLRDGQWSEVSRRELVPGDIIRLRAGDLVPADARLLFRHGPRVPRAAAAFPHRLTGMLLPYTPLAADTGFVPLPGLFFLFLFRMTITYLLLVELVKRRLLDRLVH